MTSLLQLTFQSLGTVAPGPMARVAERLYFTPRRHQAPKRERDAIAEGEATVTRFETSGGRLAGLVWEPRVFPWEPSPGTVLLVHGWEGRASQMYAFAAPLTARGFRVVALDQPAHGGSPGTTTDLPLSAQCLIEVAETLGDVRGVIAHSFGGAVVAHAFSRGLDVESAVIIGAPSSINRVARSFARIVGLTSDTESIFRGLIEKRFGPDVWTTFDAHVALSHAQARGLVVHDADDPEVPFTAAEENARAWPGAVLHRTVGLGHRRVLRDADVVEAAARFIAPPSS